MDGDRKTSSREAGGMKKTVHTVPEHYQTASLLNESAHLEFDIPPPGFHPIDENSRLDG